MMLECNGEAKGLICLGIKCAYHGLLVPAISEHWHNCSTLTAYSCWVGRRAAHLTNRQYGHDFDKKPYSGSMGSSLRSDYREPDTNLWVRGT